MTRVVVTREREREKGCVCGKKQYTLFLFMSLRRRERRNGSGGESCGGDTPATLQALLAYQGPIRNVERGSSQGTPASVGNYFLVTTVREQGALVAAEQAGHSGSTSSAELQKLEAQLDSLTKKMNEAEEKNNSLIEQIRLDVRNRLQTERVDRFNFVNRKIKDNDKQAVARYNQELSRLRQDVEEEGIDVSRTIQELQEKIAFAKSKANRAAESINKLDFDVNKKRVQVDGTIAFLTEDMDRMEKDIERRIRELQQQVDQKVDQAARQLKEAEEKFIQFAGVQGAVDTDNTEEDDDDGHTIGVQDRRRVSTPPWLASAQQKLRAQSEDASEDPCITDDDVTIGEKLMGYKVERKLGAGSYSVVYKCNKENNLYALKVLKGNGEVNKSEASREYEILKSLQSCDNVVAVKDYKDCVIVLPYCEVDLSKCTYEWKQTNALAILSGISKALLCMHELKICHRDIKSDNVLICDGVVKVTDFGISAQLKTKDDTMQEVIGTPPYMSPEAVSGSGYSMRTDVWSLGVTMAETCGGAPQEIADVLNAWYEGKGTREIILTVGQLLEERLEVDSEQTNAYTNFFEDVFRPENERLTSEDVCKLEIGGRRIGDEIPITSLPVSKRDVMVTLFEKTNERIFNEIGDDLNVVTKGRLTTGKSRISSGDLNPENFFSLQFDTLREHYTNSDNTGDIVSNQETLVNLYKEMSDHVGYVQGERLRGMLVDTMSIMHSKLRDDWKAKLKSRDDDSIKDMENVEKASVDFESALYPDMELDYALLTAMFSLYEKRFEFWKDQYSLQKMASVDNIYAMGDSIARFNIGQMRLSIIENNSVSLKALVNNMARDEMAERSAAILGTRTGNVPGGGDGENNDDDWKE